MAFHFRLVTFTLTIGCLGVGLSNAGYLRQPTNGSPLQSSIAISHPQRGPQCRYGVSLPHTFCQPDSPDLISLEPVLISDVLDRHNYWRSRVDPPAKNMLGLQWDEDLAVLAERWAATCPERSDDVKNREFPSAAGKDGFERIGHNLLWQSKASDMVDVVDSWASSANDWVYGEKHPTTEVSHYTQIVSARTEFVGCGRSHCRNMPFGDYTTVCYYGPGGNVWTDDGGFYGKPYEREDADGNGSADVTNPLRGPQCKYGFYAPHLLCLSDSDELIALEHSSKTEILDRHNFYRQRVKPPAKDLPDLQWDEDLAITAERWAAQCDFAYSSEVERRLPARGNREEWNLVGQSQFWSTWAVPTWTDAVDAFADERRNWKYGVGSANGEFVGHYTQMIWDTTLYVGCGMARCSDPELGEESILVCHYGPGGNIENQDGNPYAEPYVKA